MNDADTIVCIMCNGVVAYDNFDKTKFFKHLRYDHSIFFNQLFIMAVNSCEETFRKQISNRFEEFSNKNVDNAGIKLKGREMDISIPEKLPSPQLDQDLNISENVENIDQRNERGHVKVEKISSGFDLEIMHMNKENLSSSQENSNNLDGFLKNAIHTPSKTKSDEGVFKLSSLKANLGNSISIEVTTEINNSNNFDVPKINEISISGELKIPNKGLSTIEHHDISIHQKNDIMDEQFTKTINFTESKSKEDQNSGDMIHKIKSEKNNKDVSIKINKMTARQRADKDRYSRNFRTEAYICELCNFSSIDHKKIYRHKQTCHKENVICEVCEKSFVRKDYLKLHMNVHTQEKIFTCELCNFSSFDRRKVWSHKNNHKSKGNFSCDVCQKTLESKGSLKMHMNIHSHDKIYQCSICGKSFNCKSTLQKHEYTHGKMKPHKCELCEKGFIEKRHLNSHLLGFHKGERPFSCETCGKCFYTKNNLQRHRKVTHSNERPFHCKICNKSFKIPMILKSHMRTHSGDKPYSCNVCQKAFNQSGTLANHKKFHKNKVSLILDEDKKVIL